MAQNNNHPNDGNQDAKDQQEDGAVKFGLIIRKVQNQQGTGYNVESQNQGIPDAEVILIVEAWLEKIKENFKKPIKDNLVFSNNKTDDKKH